VHLISKRLVRAAVLAAGALVLAAPVPPTAAGTPACWKRLINDWYDGTIDKTYPTPCYRQAIAHLPTDVRLYSSARDDILRALAQAQAAQKAATTPTTAPATTAATTAESVPTTTGAAPPPTTTSEAVTPPPQTSTMTPPPATTAPVTTPGRPKKKGVQGAIDKMNPGEADSFPLPLIILGGLAIALVAAGVAGMMWRRYQGGRPGTP